jgi:octaprenyl-diphosphate synthase
VLQLRNVHNADITEAAYLEVVRRKTAKLFEAAARLGAILGGCASEVEDGFAAYGAHLGTAFQLVDDVLDYSGMERGQEPGRQDLNEGKPTLPLLHVLHRGTPAQAALVRHAIEQGGRDEFAAVLDAINRTGAMDYARAAARAEVAIACEAIGRARDSNYRQTLLNLATFAVERRY